ncbi:DALR anticodon-binding domain-containing protein 3-like isoform X2 [Glandiceps talaboti]
MAAYCTGQNVNTDGFERFQTEFEEFLLEKKICRQLQGPRRGFLLSKLTKSLKDGEFRIPPVLLKEALTTPPPGPEFSTNFPEKLQNFCDDVIRASKRWIYEIQECNVSSVDSSLLLKLHRKSTFHRVLSEVMQYEDKHTGMSNSSKGVWFINNDSCGLDTHLVEHTDISLSNLRSLYLCDHIGCLLKANGFEIVRRVNTSTGNEKTKSRLKILNIDISQHCPNQVELTDTDVDILVEGIKNSRYVVKNPNLDTSITQRKVCQHHHLVQDNSDDATRTESKVPVCLDLRQFLADCVLPLGRNGYDKNIHRLQVLNEDGKPSKILRSCAILQQYVQNVQEETSSDTPLHILHVVNYEKGFTQQQVDIAWQILHSKTAQQCHPMHYVYGAVTARKGDGATQLPNAIDFYQLRKSQMREAWVMKYGSAVEGEGWDSTIAAMTTAIIKFELLSTTARNPVKVDMSKSGSSEGKADSKGGSFVIYNYARLSTLFANYQHAVQQDLYPSLPDIDVVDFSLLREDEEWELLFHYLLPYPSLVRECVGNVTQGNPHIQILTHKVCNFLMSLSRDLSSYYGRIHVLTEPRPHLLPTMFARLYFLKAVQQVMKNGLTLLNITPLEQV